MPKTVRLRELAVADLEGTIDVYRREAGDTVALEFIDVVQRGLRRLSSSPHLGSLQFAYELGIPDLRAWPLPRFPYIVFYVVADDEIDVWRILRSQRDVPATLEHPEP